MQQRLNRQLTAWLALAAVLLSTLAPSVSHAFASLGKQAQPWQQICSAQGGQNFRWTNTAASSDQDDSVVPDGPCAYCWLGFASWAPPRNVLPPFTGTGGNHFERLAIEVFHQRRLPWAAPHSRAPPANS